MFAREKRVNFFSLHLEHTENNGNNNSNHREFDSFS